MNVVDDDVVGTSGSPKDNINHLLGAVRLIRRSLTDTNPALDFLNVYCLLYLNVQDSDNLRRELRDSFIMGYKEFRRRSTDLDEFYSKMDLFINKLKEKNAVTGECKTIERLKASLEDIDSAREQVNKTVNAYAGTQREIDNYASKLNGVQAALNSMIVLLKSNKVVIDQQATQAVKDLNASCANIVSETKAGLTATTNDFKIASDESVGKINNQVEHLNEAIKKTSTISREISELTFSIKSLHDYLRSSQEAQDVAVGDIKTKQAEDSNQISAIDQSLDKANATIMDLDSGLKKTLSELAQCKTDLEDIKSAIVRRINNVHSSLENKIGTLENTLVNKNEKLAKKVGTLQILLIAQLVISVITTVLLFVK